MLSKSNNIETNTQNQSTYNLYYQELINRLKAFAEKRPNTVFFIMANVIFLGTTSILGYIPLAMFFYGIVTALALYLDIKSKRDNREIITVIGMKFNIDKYYLVLPSFLLILYSFLIIIGYATSIFIR